MGPGAGSDHGSQEKAIRPAPLTGGFYWLPLPGHPTISWDVVTCHQLGFDAEVGHVELWTAVIEQIASTWHKDAAALRRRLKNCCYGLPRGRVTRPGKCFLVLHGNDSPRPDWLESLILRCHLDRLSVKVLFDEHERTMPEDRRRVMDVLGASAN